MKKKYIYYRKVLNPLQKSKLDGLSEFKISLKEVDKKHIEVMKSYLHIAINNILRDINNFDAKTAKEYLKLAYSEALVNLYNLKVPEVSDFSLKKQKDILKLEDVIDRYIKSQSKDGIPKGTLKNYRNYKRQLLDFFNEHKDIETITPTDVEEYQDYLIEQGKIGGTINNIIAFPKGVFNYCIEMNLISYNPFNSVKNLKYKSNKQQLSHVDVFNILKTIDNKVFELIIKIGLYAGFRIEEIYNLKVENIDLENRFIFSDMPNTSTKIHTRVNPIHPLLFNDLKKAIGKRKSGKLIYFNGEKRSFARIQILINNIVKNVTGTSLKTFHGTRATFAKQLEDFNLKDIKILMGHTSSDVTVKDYLKDKTNWKKKVEMIEQIDYSNMEISKVELAIMEKLNNVA